MANPEQLDLLKSSVEGWNNWRKGQPDTKAPHPKIKLEDIDFNEVDLSRANLFGADLRKANLNGVNLASADLGTANLSSANLFGADLFGADLSYADLSNANFRGADLRTSNLIGANLNGADLRAANLNGANLVGVSLIGAHLTSVNLIRANLIEANLREADLREANLSGTLLSGVNFGGAMIGSTTFENTDLSKSNELETIDHYSPSSVGTDTLQLSKGKIPNAFLRGCGLSDILIETANIFNPDLTNEEIIKIQYRIYDLRATQALQISPLFISYSHTDTDFVNQIDFALTEKGIRFWRDIHDAKAGRLETQIDLAIRQNPTVLLILSKNSLNSDWVQHEVRKARELEKELRRDALCPIALDDSWKSSKWPSRIMEQIKEYNILDFSGWEDKQTFESKFAKLLGGLNLFYKKPTT